MEESDFGIHLLLNLLVSGFPGPLLALVFKRNVNFFGPWKVSSKLNQEIHVKTLEIFCPKIAKLTFCGIRLAIHVSFMMLIGILNESRYQGH